MIVYLNGRFVPEEQAVVSVHDRGFLYGDGIFEAVRIYAGEPFLWREHMERFSSGAKELEIAPPLSDGEMRRVVAELAARNRMREAIARISLSRGAGPRGYSTRGATHPTFVVALHPAPKNLPETTNVVVATHRLFSGDKLARFKHSNKLVQVAARLEADKAGADEALLLNEHGYVVEGTSSNLFWIDGRAICTSPLEEGILAGTTRSYIARLAREHGIAAEEKLITPKELIAADGVFLTSCAIEVQEVVKIGGEVVRRSPVAAALKTLYPHGIASSK